MFIHAARRISQAMPASFLTSSLVLLFSALSFEAAALTSAQGDSARPESSCADAYKGIVALVNPVSSGAGYAKRLIDRGYMPIELRTWENIPATFAPSHRPEDFAHSYVIPMELPEEAITWLQDQVNLLGLIAGADEGTAFADWANQQFGFGQGNGASGEDLREFDSNLRRAKYPMIEAVKTSGLRVANQVKANNINEILEWHRKQHGEWPVILKPPRSSGQDRIMKCHSEAELVDNFNKVIGETDMHLNVIDEVIVQEFIPGTEYIVETISVNGQHHLLYMFEYDSVPVPGTSALTHTASLLPVGHLLEEKVSSYVFGVNNAVGIRTGPGHHEVIIHEKTGEVVLIETAARPAGGNLPQWVYEARGIDELDLTITANLEPQRFQQQWEESQKRIQDLNGGAHVKEVLIKALEPGRIQTRQLQQAIQDLPSFRSITWKRSEGSELEVTTDLGNVIAYVVLIDQDPEQIALDYAQLRQWEDEQLFSEAPNDRSLADESLTSGAGDDEPLVGAGSQ